ncbi:pyridoxamine 5'-phosphate oxidase family protein [Haloactinospora alba]|nr:pyridoxamine 5'-phosphate oxidase family protein [Haloactinospora alba]
MENYAEAAEAASLLGLAVERLRAVPFGTVVTVGEGEPHARLVQHLAVEEDGTVWVGASPRSRKVADVRRDPRVAYAVEDRDAFGYVTAQADAEIVDDPRERARRWEEGLAAFFPAGPHGDDFVLLRLVPYRVEVMDFARGVHPDPYGLVPAVIERTADGRWARRPAQRD